MQVVDKMQNQQTKLLVTLQAEKKKVSTVSAQIAVGPFHWAFEHAGWSVANRRFNIISCVSLLCGCSILQQTPPSFSLQMRQHVSSRLGASSEKGTRATTTAAEGKNVPPGGKQRNAVKKGKSAALAVQAAVRIEATAKEVAGVEDNRKSGIDDDANDNDLGGGTGQLTGVDLLDACERLENDNLGLRQRLAKLELQKMQKEHGEDDEELNDDSQLIQVIVDSTPSSCWLIPPSLLGVRLSPEESSPHCSLVVGLSFRLRHTLQVELECEKRSCIPSRDLFVLGNTTLDIEGERNEAVAGSTLGGN